MVSGVFITFEGIDRSGKSTQAKLLAEKLGDQALLVREPGGTEASERIRELLLDPEAKITPQAEALLYAAARAQLVAQVIKPALTEGRTVICDRYVDSSLAYQGLARGLGLENVLEINEFAIGGLWPDCTVLIEIDPDQAAKRDGEKDRLEEEGLALQHKVAAGFKQLAERYPERIYRIDGGRSVEQVHGDILQALQARLEPLAR